MKDIFVITQCRLSSSRLKNKILLPLNNSTVLDFFLNRVKKITCEKVLCAVADEFVKKKIIRVLKNAKVE